MKSLYLLSSIVITTSLTSDILINNKNLFASNEVKILKKSAKHGGVNRIEDPWYYFGMYAKVYVSHKSVNAMYNDYINSGPLAAGTALLSEMAKSGINPAAYSIFSFMSGSIGPLTVSLIAWKPWEYDAGNGVVWKQYALGVIGAMWAQ